MSDGSSPLATASACFVPQQVAPLLLDAGDFVMDASRATTNLGGGGDEEAATGEDAPFYVGEEALTKCKQALAPGLGRGKAGVTTSVMKLSRAALIVASWSSSLEPKRA